jgi:predicted component of type VI protein secretion system
MSELMLVDERDEGARRYLVRPDMTIGRRRCDLQLSEPGVSRRHAMIEHFASGYAIRDLGSRTGVLVNGDRISAERTLEPDDRIAIGPVTLRVEHFEADAAASQPARHRPAPPLPPPDPVPPAVMARVSAPAEAPIEFPAARRRSRRRSQATSERATAFCFLVLLADAVALAFYLASN